MLNSLHTHDLVLHEPEPVDWIVENIVARGAVTLMYGAPGIGKSLLALALAGAMTGDTTVGGFAVKRAPAILVDAENGEYELARRLHSFNFNGQCGKHFEAYDMGLGVDINHIPCIEQEMGGLMWAIENMTPRPQLVILDSLRSLWITGDVNDPIRVTQFFRKLQKLARDYETGILVLHHPNRGGDYAGTVALVAVSEIACRIGRNQRDKDTTRRYLIWDKCRPAPDPTRKWFRIVPSFGGTQIELASRPTAEELWPDD